jgi:hypothetical protein
MATAVLTRGPAALTEALEEIEAYATRRGVNRLEELVGMAADRARSYADMEPGRPLRPWERYYANMEGADAKRD